MNIKRLGVLTLIFISACGSEDPPTVMAEPTVLRTLTGFEQPESAHYHEGSDRWFVSNIAGETGVKDNRGWISLLSAEGDVLQARWLQGLNAPTGITSAGDRLYVADVDQVHVIDVQSAQIIESKAFEGAVLLNDLVVGPDQTVYVSDTFAQAVFSWRPGEQPQVFLRDDTNSFPNGLAFFNDRLMLAGIGPFDDLTATAPLFEVQTAPPLLQPLPDARAKFDGMIALGDHLWLTDFRARLLRWDGRQLTQALDLAALGLLSAADLGADKNRRRLAIPDLFGGSLTLIEVP